MKYATEEERIAARKEASRRYYERNKDLVNDKAKRRYESNKELAIKRARARKLLVNYGLTVDDYNARLYAQGGVCAICKERPAPSNPFVVDHCHDTGRVRGIVHRKCNTAIGMLRDSPALVASALEYLRA